MKSRTAGWIFAWWVACTIAACGSEPVQSRSGGPRPVGGTAGAAPLGPGSPPNLGSAGAGFDNPGQAIVPVTAPPPPDGRCNQDVDIVFVLDVSGSMIPPLTTLEREVGLVDQALESKNLPSAAHYGLVVFVDDVAVLNGGMPYADVNALKQELIVQRDLTNLTPPRQLNGNIDNLSWPENSLDALHAAATKFQWRPVDKTLRMIILITDASFWDLTAPSSNHASEQNGGFFPAHVSMNGYDQTIAALREHKIWVNTFAAKTGGPPDGMISPPSHGEWRGTSVNVGIGFFEPYQGKPTIAMSTGGVAWNIDDVFDMKISLAAPINMSIEARQCEMYPA